MEFFTISAGREANLVKRRLEDEFTELREDGINVTVSEATDGSYRLFSCEASIGPHNLPGDPQDILNYYLASAVTDTIVYDLESTTLERLIRAEYPDLGQEDYSQIVNLAKNTLSVRNTEYVDPYLLNRRTVILYRLLDYLDKNSHLNVEGFVRFRLQSYTAALRRTLDRVVEEYVAAKEYREFVELLRYFVSLQEPLIDLVHVVSNTTGRYELLDADHQKVEHRYLQPDIATILELQINNEDLLISALITLAPARIVIHGEGNTDFEDTIADVFQERVQYCDGCSLCQKETAPSEQDPNATLAEHNPLRT